jgi:hypothetical protein
MTKNKTQLFHTTSRPDNRFTDLTGKYNILYQFIGPTKVNEHE